MKAKETSFLSSLKTDIKKYQEVFWWAFGVINLVFLFYSANFMFGDHDWNYVRSANYWSEGAFEGRPLHFVLQSLFFGGEVLPILNNLLAFAALALSGILLAKYWQIPFSKGSYILFSIFIAVQPYTMVWLFYAKDMLINLALPLIVIAGLLAADKAVKNKNLYYHIVAVFLCYFALASYVAIINLFGVCLLGNIIILYTSKESKLSDIIKQKLPVVVDICIALILFEVTLKILPMETGYNTKTISLDYLPQKFVETLSAMFTQFVAPLPFIDIKFKLVLLGLSLFGLIALIIKSELKKIPLLFLGIIGILFASKLAFFIADERGQILAEMENYAFVPRLDFYGLVYVYAFCLACVLIYTKDYVKKTGVAIAIIITFMACIRDVYAQKVWKLGFDAEMKAHERIVSRIENMPNFYPDRHYRLFQVGTLSLRKNYYLEQKDENVSLDLLTTSFTPQFMSTIVYNFYYPKDIFYRNAFYDDLSEDGKQWLDNIAQPFPHQNSIYIDGDIIIVVLQKMS